jgi:hypothetical protein
MSEDFMEIKCPRCQTMLTLGERAALFPCPSCRTPLEIVMGETGFTIVGVDREEQQKASLRTAEDSVLNYYTKWQEGASFALAAAACCAFVLFIDIKSAYLTYGFFFWKNPENLIVTYIAGSLFFLFLLGGAGIFFFAAKRKRVYRERLRQEKSAIDPGGVENTCSKS